jgi:cellulose synthase/poly-beta-1,6-N-acetylglucosamine synthase-like glycosyltransferase
VGAGDGGAMIDRLLTVLLVANQWTILAFFLAMNLTNLVLILRSYFATRRYLGEVEADRFEDYFESSHSKPLTLICPVFNEEAGVVASVSSLLGLHYPEFQVIVVNDGSTDGTLGKLVAAYHLHPSARVVRTQLATLAIRATYESAYLPKLVVVDKDNGGKADALNCGLNLARYPLVCCVDGDCIIENDALLRAARPFLDRPNVVASAGVIRPLNGCKVTPMGIRGIFLPGSWLARMQVVEYLRSFLFGRMGLSSLGSMFIVSGAFSIFRKDLLLEIGGYRKTIGEDFEVVVRIHHHLMKQRRSYRIVMVPDPLCWTEVPEDAATLSRQRNRWQRGMLDALWGHREMWFNPEYGRIGMFSMPYFLVFEAAAPVIELLGYLFFLYALAAHKTYGPFAVAFFCVALLLGITNNYMAIAMEQITLRPYPRLRDWAILLWCGIAEHFGYRQLILVWRAKGIIDWLRGKQAWGQMRRVGSAGPGAGG